MSENRMTTTITEPPVFEPLPRPPKWASGYGQDEFGYFAEFSVVTGSQYWDFVTQRMRWIPTGTFLMGAQKGEQTFIDDEKQHRVTISSGFWMADTTCTQELWEVVMRTNPSHFTGPLRPVEDVSFDDVYDFLFKLNKRLGAGSMALPTEAQWEYSCRAGTKTAFSFGESITTEQANFNGNYPYRYSHKGSFREETVEVKSLAANSWGLFQMHGNVWEWCSDFYAPYSSKPQLDPVGPQSGSDRVLRGGSWSDSARNMRSACRRWYDPCDGGRNLGFRLMSSASPVQPGPP